MTTTANMSDEDIRDNLILLGRNVGPVVDSTREFYRRKLARILGELKDEPVLHASGTEGSESENEASEEKGDDTEGPVKGKLFSDTYSPPTQIRGRRSVNAQMKGSPVISSYKSSSTFNQKINPVPQKADKKNIVMMICFVLGSAVIVYLTMFSGESSTAIEGS